MNHVSCPVTGTDRLIRQLHVKEALSFLSSKALSLSKFIYYVSWGHPACVADSQIRAAQTVLMHSAELPLILQNWWKPPRSASSHKSHTKAARLIMEEFAAKCLREVLDRELEDISDVLRNDDDMSEEFFTSTAFDELAREFRTLGPNLWALLRRFTYTEKQERRNKSKDPDKIVLMIIAMLCYTRSHHVNRLQKLFAVYLKFRGLSVKAFDTLHALAITMSHKWTANHVAKILEGSMKEVKEVMELFPWLVPYDNINIPFRVFSQRLDNKDNFSSGVAATVYIKCQATELTANINKDLQECRAAGMKNPITPEEIFAIDCKLYPHICRQTTYKVLRFLLHSPEFQFKTYAHRDSTLLAPPPLVHALPHGHNHITLQYIIGSINNPKASYADNERVMDEILSLLGLNGTPEKQCHLATEKIIAWAGDQLTIDRLRGLFKYRSQETNSFDRLDWMVLMFGWLHLQMAFANSLHAHEALYHVAEAHVQLDWQVVAGTNDLAELCSRTPEELIMLAEKLVDEHASSEALEQMDCQTEDERDEVKRQTTIWNRDVLHYIMLDQAIKHGDVALMEAMVPTLLFQFTGGRNSKYVIEMLELWQGLHKEWPPAVQDFVREHCWLVNFEGKPNSFLPIDMAQEHNIKDIKVTYKSEGPNIKWEYFKKLHPAIHVICKLGKHMEKEFNTLTRGKKHGVPKKDTDVMLLESSYREARLHEKIPGHKLKGLKRDKVVDVLTKGAVKLHTGHSIDRWV
ncbi:hypothetical protein PAXINDRAFT_164295 [Paxillus involutus ATCC 200175]|uniref:DUF6589 domain-containing protein n=1 Tax=Paxillus involutus ATCC 200175 TaxID=664439 RepID=A0A0C9THC3_PAXIN|nr:hypothetical protein PAXINDRAFT_164295 [Paxillus involutus ATCC 200175]